MGNRTYAWSFSKMTEECPHKFFRLHIKKDVKDEGNYATSRGGKVHKALEMYGKVRAGGATRKRAMKQIEKYTPKGDVDTVRSYAMRKLDKLIALPADDIVFEEKMVVGKKFAPLRPKDWFDNSVARGRAAADLSLSFEKLSRSVMIDYKTGRIYPDKLKKQGGVLAAMKFITDPDVEEVNFRAHNLDQWDFSFSVTYAREDLPRLLIPIKSHLAEVQERVRSKEWEKVETFLCRYCPVKDCQFNQS